MGNKKPLVVGVDIRDLRIAKTGQKTVLEELCRQFKRSKDTSLSFVFLDSNIPLYTGTNKIILILEHLRYQLWKQLILPVKAWYHHCDILFCGDYFTPYLHFGYKTIEVFHDAFFFEYPAHYNRLWLQLFHRVAMPAARRCTYIVTTTAYAKKQVIHYTHIPEEKLVSIYPGPKTLLHYQSATAHTISLQPLATQQYILHVGVFEKRKNLVSLIRAFGLLRTKGYSDLKLVLAGKGNGKKFSDDTVDINKTIQELHLTNHVIITDYLPDADIAFLYRHACMYVFPSINEGFGIPILEAFSFQLPVLVADNTCLPEVGGDAVLCFDPFNEQDMCNKMQQVLDDTDLRNILIGKGKQRLQEFTWAEAGSKLIDLFKRAHGDQ